MSRLEDIRARHEAATPGTWVAHDLGDLEYNSQDNEGWWWVWRKENLPYYGGVFTPTDSKEPDGSILEATITGNEDGKQEKADAEFAAHAHQDIPPMLDALESVEDTVIELESELYRLRTLFENDEPGEDSLKDEAKGAIVVLEHTIKSLKRALSKLEDSE